MDCKSATKAVEMTWLPGNPGTGDPWWIRTRNENTCASASKSFRDKSHVLNDPLCGSPAEIRTPIHGSKGRCPTIRRPGNFGMNIRLPT